MLKARSLCLRARKTSDDPTTATAPARTTFPAMSREPCDLLIRAAAFFGDQLNSVSSIHMRCSITANLRATATLVLQSPCPKPSAPTISARGSTARRPFRTDNAEHGITTLRYPARPIDLSRGMVPGGQSDIGTDTSRLLEPDRIVDCRLEAECGDRVDARRGHEPANLIFPRFSGRG